MQKTWNLPDDTHKVRIIQHMGVLFRKWKVYLNDHYLSKGKTPFEKYDWITEAQWNEYVEYRQSPAFQVISMYLF